jgi:hypothetical protein
MVWVIAFGSPDNSVISPKVYASKIKATYQTFSTVTTPAAETKLIGLPADAQAVMVFASPLRQFYRDGTTSYRLPGFSHLGNFVWTSKLASVYQDFAKTTPSADTVGNSPYHRAVSGNCPPNSNWRKA